MVFVRVTGRAIVNLHSANAEGSVGNYMPLSKMFIVRRGENGKYDIMEDIVISGNMMKHWHAVRTVEHLKEAGSNALCNSCKRFIMYRSNMEYDDEFDFVKECAIEDLHGFLQPNKQVRRESIVKFAFMIPVEEVRAEYAAVTHNRVFTDEAGKIPGAEQAMMVFKREYASGVYGFSCLMDLAYVGRPLSDPENSSKVLNSYERKLRAKSSILALADVLSGQFGASSSRALPIIQTIEFVCAVAKQPLPNLVHGFFRDYAEESCKILKATLDSKLIKDLKVFVAGDRIAKSFSELPGNVVNIESSFVEAIAKAAEVVEEWLG